MRDVLLVVEVAPYLPPVRRSNDRLVQVSLNLADAMREGGESAKGTLSIRALRDSTEKSLVGIDVEDTGPGIDPAMRAKVFEPFFTTKPAGEGTGLGLAICASLVDQAGGSLRDLARVDGGRGALLRVELPEAART